MLAPLLLCFAIAFCNAADNITVVPNILAASNSASCLWGWTPIGSRCFFFEKTVRTWTQAELHCIELGGNLASIHRKYEYDAVVQMITEQTSIFPRTWLGGTDAVEEGTWFWSDGKAFDFTNWAPGQPDHQDFPWLPRFSCCIPTIGRPVGEASFICPFQPPPYFPCPVPHIRDRQDCMTMNYGATHAWDNDWCYEQYPSICARDG